MEKKTILGVFIVVALLTMPSVLAERHVGTNVILNVEQFESTRLNTSNNIRVLSASDDVPQFMSVSGNVDLKNWFYWLVTTPSIPIFCIVDIMQPMARNYTYSINIPLEYIVNASNSTWAEIVSDKFKRNITLNQLLSGSTRFDVDYDGEYTVTVYGNTSGGICNAVASFAVDRTSDFGENKSHVMAFIIIFMVGFAGYVYMFGRTFRDNFQLSIKSLAFFFIYTAFVISLLAVREYIKVPSIYDQLSAIYFASIIIFNLILAITIVLFIIDSINYYNRSTINKWEGTKVE